MPDRLTGRTLVIATGHALSLALLADGRLIARHDEPVDRGHAERLIPALAGLLQRGESLPPRCDMVLFEVGPGSFTGLRIGAAAARALALAWGARLAGVRSTLLVAAKARALGIGDLLAVGLKAPRGQIWLERFAAGGLESLGPPVALPADRLPEMPGCVGAGNAFANQVSGLLLPEAASAAFLAPSDLDAPDLLYVREASLDAAA